MVRRFDAASSWPARALQAWLTLIGLAHNRQTVTYGRLADYLGSRRPVFSPKSSATSRCCKPFSSRRLSLLPNVVVSHRRTGLRDGAGRRPAGRGQTPRIGRGATVDLPASGGFGATVATAGFPVVMLNG